MIICIGIYLNFIQNSKKVIEQHTIPETQYLLKLVQFLQLHQQIQPHHTD